MCTQLTAPPSIFSNIMADELLLSAVNVLVTFNIQLVCQTSSTFFHDLLNEFFFFSNADCIGCQTQAP